MAKVRRRKSARQINEQALRLVQESAVRGYNNRNIDGEHNRQIARMERIRDIANRYTKNIATRQGNPNGYISNENYEKQVSRSAYMGLTAG